MIHGFRQKILKESLECERERSVEYSPQQNGTTERMNRTLVEMARCMLLLAKLPQSFWAEAIFTAVYIRNRCPTRDMKNSAPFEQWFARKPSISHLKTFGSDSTKKWPGCPRKIKTGNNGRSKEGLNMFQVTEQHETQLVIINQ